jgi:drug/metabolite transporter (DMT)-like permease
MTIVLSILAGLLAMTMYGLANAFSKPLSQKFGSAQMLFLRGFTIIIILAVASATSYHYLQNWMVALAAVGLGVAGYLPVLAFTHGIKESPLGVIAPIAGTAPLITVLLSSAFLSVNLHPAQWVAIVVVVLANIAVSVDLKNWRQSKSLQKSTGIPYALVAAAGWGLFFFLLVPFSRALGPWLAALLVEVGVTVAAGLHIVFSGQKVDLGGILSPKVMLNGALVCTGTVAFTVGVNYFNVGIVAALSNSTALITTLLGVYLFGEALHRKERLAGAVMVLGVAALSVL